MERNKSKYPLVEKPKPKRKSSFFSFLDNLSSFKEEPIWQKELKVKVQTRGLPFMLLPLSDIHLGSKATDYKKLQEYLVFLKNYPVYTVLLGDLADNFSPVSHPSGMMGNAVNPTEQWSRARVFFKEYEDKILAVVSGNHDDWTKDKAGIDMYRFITSELNIPLLQAGGLLRLKVDNQEYKIRLYHKIAKLNSQFNLTHAGKQTLRLTGDDADVIISGDKHLGAVEQVFIGDKKRIIIQLGTFKIDDDWGKRQGFVQRPYPFYPVLFFFQGQHNVEIIEDLKQVAEIIKTMQKHYKQLAVSLLGYGREKK